LSSFLKSSALVLYFCWWENK